MTDVIIDTAIQSKRRLPTWMQGNDASKNEKLGDSDELCSISGNQPEAQGAVSMIESLSSEIDLVPAEKRNNSNNIEINVKKYSKKNARKPIKREGSKDSRHNSSGAKKKSEGDVVERGKSIDAQHMKLRSAKNNSLDVLSQGMIEDEAELTVEDLISIAEEFLTSEKEIQNEGSVAQKSESDLISLSSSDSAIPRRRKLNGDIRLSKCTKKQTEESITSSANKIIRTGDAARDMLELFLGPLLKKAPLKDPETRD